MNQSSSASFSESVDHSDSWWSWTSPDYWSWSSGWYPEDDPVSWKVSIGLIYGCISLVTVVGNLMVIVAFAKDARINRKIANWYIVNLSVADLIAGIVLAINATWLVSPRRFWPFGEIPCKIWLSLDSTVVTVGVFSIIFISLDRYWLLTKKLAYPKYQTKRTATGLIVFGWTICIIFYGVVNAAWIPITGLEQHVFYIWSCEMEASYNFEYQLFIIVVLFVVPLVTIICLNLIVYQNIRQRSKGFVQSKPVASSKDKPKDISANQEKPSRNDKENKSLEKSNGARVSTVSLHVQSRATTDRVAVKGGKPSSDTKRAEFNRHRKAAIILAVLVSVFIICWAPFHVTAILYVVCDVCYESDIFWTSWEVTGALLWCNSTINPFLYAAMNPHFRQNFINFLGLAKFMKKKDDVVTSTQVESSK